MSRFEGNKHGSDKSNDSQACNRADAGLAMHQEAYSRTPFESRGAGQRAQSPEVQKMLEGFQLQDNSGEHSGQKPRADQNQKSPEHGHKPATDHNQKPAEHGHKPKTDQNQKSPEHGHTAADHNQKPAADHNQRPAEHGHKPGAGADQAQKPMIGHIRADGKGSPTEKPSEDPYDNESVKLIKSLGQGVEYTHHGVTVATQTASGLSSLGEKSVPFTKAVAAQAGKVAPLLEHAEHMAKIAPAVTAGISIAAGLKQAHDGDVEGGIETGSTGVSAAAAGWACGEAGALATPLAGVVAGVGCAAGVEFGADKLFDSMHKEQQSREALKRINHKLQKLQQSPIWSEYLKEREELQHVQFKKL